MQCFRSRRVLRDGPDSGDDDDAHAVGSRHYAPAGPAAVHAHKMGPLPHAALTSLPAAAPPRLSSGRTRAVPGRVVRTSGESGRESRGMPQTPPQSTPVRRVAGGAATQAQAQAAQSLRYAASQPLHAAAAPAGEASPGRRRGSPGRKGSAAAVPRSPARDANGKCDKCDGDHDTDACPHYPRARDEHPDATRRTALGGMGGNAGKFTLRNARVVRQPGDGDCLYHSLAHGLGARGCSASVLRRELAAWVAAHGDERIADTPLSDWVRWDSGLSCGDYAVRMAVSGWGGGVEMAAFARLKRTNVHVYERRTGLLPGFKRISCFDAPAAPDAPLAKTVHVLYGGGVHYDLLEPTGSSIGSGWELRL